VFVALLGLLLLSGCITPPTVPMVDSAESMKAKTFKAPKKDKAGIYVYRIKTFTGSALTKTVWIDKKCVGDTASGVFFYQEVDGNKDHTISTQSEFSPNDMVLHTKGGELYFIEQFIKMGVFVGGADLAQRDASVGKEEVRKLNMAKQGNCSVSYEKK
jgi:hypothetical protein